ncbi:restriction endonuclease subunit S [Methanimicrococcus blatticola]|uniref:Type I restriction enzyme S subunit n=1 Tax=Methanimicrococcus blatticola TaxID=91560 RepID=A0A484F6M2_9EURY|nr:restriction endonuclease subunit S [Methanimicrococcus blatticola]MBZ3934930.1 restriction endonuclease subunit S [Methanimicrococcus blatticola]MCC2508971.1 restriction endonuclease subunit S [Methanimicrococcus blatticola]TDQ70998.1 type I restriction enzyme S subunit [Methanimicrococcus blatticola]
MNSKEVKNIPSNWTITNLGSIAKWGSGGTPSRKNPEFYSGTIPWIKTGELSDSFIYDSEEKINQDAIDKSSAKLFPKNSVLIAMYGATIGKCAILGVEATTNQACAAAIVNDNIYYKYLFHYLVSQKDAFLKKGKGGAQPNISQEILKAHPIPIPPFPEQQRIVDRIESLFEKLDQAKKLAQKALDQFEERKAAILHKAFTGELTREWRKNHNFVCDFSTSFDNDVILFEIPDCWIWTTFGEITTIIGGGTPPSNVDEYYENGTIPWISPSDLSNYKSKYISKGKKNITELGLSKSSARLMPKGTVLLSSRAPIGYVAIAENELCTNQGFKSFLPNFHYLPLYLYYYLIFMGERLESYASGTTFLELSGKRISQIGFPVPPIEEQERIVSILDEIFTFEDQSNELIDVIEQIDLIKKSILARAFRGELGTNNPNEEKMNI